VFLRDTTEQAVNNLLQQIYHCSRGPRWLLPDGVDPYLYVDFYEDARREFETDEWIALRKALGGEPAVSLVVDISGRHPGDEQVKEFVSTVLSNLHGVAQDEYTIHCWSLQEILSGHQEEGHPFFDYNGWYREEQQQGGSAIDSGLPDSLRSIPLTLESVHNLAKSGRVIEAIWAYRQISGVGLKEAKDYIDRIEKDY